MNSFQKSGSRKPQKESSRTDWKKVEKDERAKRSVVVDDDDTEVSDAELARAKRRGRGPQKAPTKLLVSVRLDRAVVGYFKASGPGWQTRINKILTNAVSGGKRSKRAA